MVNFQAKTGFKTQSDPAPCSKMEQDLQNRASGITLMNFFLKYNCQNKLKSV